MLTTVESVDAPGLFSFDARSSREGGLGGLVGRVGQVGLVGQVGGPVGPVPPSFLPPRQLSGEGRGLVRQVQRKDEISGAHGGIRLADEPLGGVVLGPFIPAKDPVVDAGQISRGLGEVGPNLTLHFELLLRGSRSEG